MIFVKSALCRGFTRAFRAGVMVACSSLIIGPSYAEPFTKSLEFIVGSDAAGGYDTYARILARHLPKYLPGAPAIAVKNQPGAGSGRTAAHIARIAPRDGTSVGIVFPGVIVGPLLDRRQSWQFDPSKFVYVGSADSGTRVCFVSSASKIRSFEDTRREKTILGASAQGGSTRDYAYMLNHTAGSKFEVVSGYKGSADIFLAVERGEVDGMCGLDWGSLRSQRPQWLSGGKIRIILQTAIDPEPDLERQGVPMVWRFVADEADRRAVELVVSQQIFGRPFILPPGVAPDAARLLREGFSKAMADADLRADAQKANIDIQPSDGEKVQALVEKLYKLPQSTLDRAQRIIQP